MGLVSVGEDGEKKEVKEKKKKTKTDKDGEKKKKHKSSKKKVAMELSEEDQAALEKLKTTIAEAGEDCFSFKSDLMNETIEF